MTKAMPANTGKNLLSLLLMSAPEPKHTGAAFAAQRAAGLRPRRSPEQALCACSNAAPVCLGSGAEIISSNQL